jgi:hypothetical protein
MPSEPAGADLPGPAEIAAVAEASGQADPQRLNWTVEPIDHANLIDTTGGLFHVHGHPRDSDAPADWSCVVKVVQQSEISECDAPDSWCYWRREAAFYSSDLPASLPAALRAPECYAVTERSASCWVWLERVADDLVEVWQLDDYHRVAVAAGESAGAHLARGRPPSRPWLVPGFARSVLAEGGLWSGFMSRESTESAWSAPLVQQSFDRVDNERYDSLWARRHDLLAVLERLPQMLCHNDFHRRNVLLPRDGTRSPVVVDWAFAGSGGVATDAAQLTAGTLFFCDVDIRQAQDLDDTVFDGYLEGLRRSGWDGDERLVRLGLAASIALNQGITLPGWVGLALSEEDDVDSQRLFGAPASSVRDAWVELYQFALQRADEAASLSRQLGLSRLT